MSDKIGSELDRMTADGGCQTIRKGWVKAQTAAATKPEERR